MSDSNCKHIPGNRKKFGAINILFINLDSEKELVKQETDQGQGWQRPLDQTLNHHCPKYECPEKVF